MRLIDADKLVKEIEMQKLLLFSEARQQIRDLEVIDEQPTIEENKWIPVEENLPNSIDKYLVSLRENRGIAIQIFDGESFKAEVIAWQKRPEAYTKGE